MEEKKNALDEENLERVSGGNADKHQYMEELFLRNSIEHITLLTGTCPICGSHVCSFGPIEWRCEGCNAIWKLID